MSARADAMTKGKKDHCVLNCNPATWAALTENKKQPRSIHLARWSSAVKTRKFSQESVKFMLFVCVATSLVATCAGETVMPGQNHAERLASLEHPIITTASRVPQAECAYVWNQLKQLQQELKTAHLLLKTTQQKLESSKHHLQASQQKLKTSLRERKQARRNLGSCLRSLHAATSAQSQVHGHHAPALLSVASVLTEATTGASRPLLETKIAL